MHTKTLQAMYQNHHASHREEGFSILEQERGDLFSKYIGTGKRVLDIGCRDGVLTRHFSSGNKCTGIDIDQQALQRDENAVQMQTIHTDLQGDWKELAGKSFDAVVAGKVLEHLYFPERVVERIVRHLTPSGLCVGSVPNAFSIKNRIRYLLGRKKYTPLADPTHINQFSVSEIRVLFETYFSHVTIIGLGRYRILARVFPSWFAFDIVFVADTKK